MRRRRGTRRRSTGPTSSRSARVGVGAAALLLSHGARALPGFVLRADGLAGSRDVLGVPPPGVRALWRVFLVSCSMTERRPSIKSHVGREVAFGERIFHRRRWPQHTITASRSGCAVRGGRRRKARSSPMFPMCVSGFCAGTVSRATSRPTWSGTTGTSRSPAGGCTAPTARSSRPAPSVTAQRWCSCRRRPTWWWSALPCRLLVMGCSDFEGPPLRGP